MARHTKTNSIDGISWFDPMKLSGRDYPFVWEDGVHAVRSVEYTQNGIAYVLKCGTMFTFYSPGAVIEARIRLPVPNCKKCLE